MTSRKRFLSNTAMLYIMSISQLVFPLLTFPYLTRILEPGLYGVITYLVAVTGYVRTFIKFGFDLSSTKQITDNRDDLGKIGLILGSTMQSSVFLAFISLIAFSVVTVFIPIMHEYMLMAYLYLFGVFLEILLPDFLFLGLQRMSSITYRYLIAKTASTVLIFIVVRTKADIYWIPILNIIGTFLAASLVWFQIWHTLRIKITFSGWKDILAKLKDSGIYFISKFATTAFGITNTFVLGLVGLPIAQISYWGVGYNLVGSAMNLYNPIMSSLYPHMIAKKDTKLIRWLLFGLFPVIIITTVLVFFYSDTVIRVFCGPKYGEAVPVFKALLPLLILAFPVQVLGFPVLGAYGQVKKITNSTISAAVFHIAGLALLFAFGKFSLLNVALLRCGTEAVLLATRCYFLLSFLRKRRVRAHT